MRAEVAASSTRLLPLPAPRARRGSTGRGIDAGVGPTDGPARGPRSDDDGPDCTTPVRDGRRRASEPRVGGAASTVPAAPPPPSSSSTLPSDAVPPPVAGGRVYTATLTGDPHRGGRGDPDGSGRARVSLHSGKNLLWLALTTSGVAPVTSCTSTRYRRPPRTRSSPPPPRTAPDPQAASPSAEVLRAVRKNPTGYYLEVHNAEFPDGALRGYLSR